MESKGSGVLDTPLEPVIGLAEGEIRWRGMTAFVWATKWLPSVATVLIAPSDGEKLAGQSSG
jgi:hypothetical protein